MRIKWLALPALLLLMVLAAACGSSDKTGSEAASSEDTAGVEANTQTAGDTAVVGPNTGGASSAAATTEASTEATDTSASSESTAAPESTEGTESTAAAGNTVPQGGVLKGAMQSDINTWDGTDYYAYAWMVNSITCDKLVDYPNTSDAVQNATLRPDLAEAMPEVSSDGLTYTFTLRSGVKFSNGNEVTGDDVKGTFLRMNDPKAAFQAFGTTYYDAIDGVPAYKKGTAQDIPGITVDGNKVTFKLTKVDGGFLPALALGFACIVPKDSPHQKTNLPPPMTGAYMVSEHTQGKSLKIVRNPVWEDNVKAGLPVDPNTNNVDGFDVEIGVPPEQQVLRIKNGDLDFSFDQSAPVGAQVNEVATDPALKGQFFAIPSLRVTYVWFNVSTPPFDNVKLRQAANYAIDRTALVKLYGGKFVGSPLSNILPTAMMPKGANGLPYPATPDLDKAKQLVQESGVANPKATILCRDNATDPDVVQEIKSDLSKAGFDITIKPCLNTDNYYQYIQNPKNKAQFGMAGWEADYPDAITYFGPLLISGAAGGGSNYGQFKDPDFDAQVEKINEMPPGPERLAAWADLATTTETDKAPWMNIYQVNNLNLLSKNYGGYYYGGYKTIYLALAYDTAAG